MSILMEGINLDPKKPLNTNTNINNDLSLIESFLNEAEEPEDTDTDTDIDTKENPDTEDTNTDTTPEPPKKLDIIDTDQLTLTKIFTNLGIIKDSLKLVTHKLTELKNYDNIFEFTASLETQCNKLIKTIDLLMDTDFGVEKKISYITAYSSVLSSFKILNALIEDYSKKIQEEKNKK